MVKGLDVFREKFRPFEGAFVLIGGAACDDWFAQNSLPFRSTKDLDIVLIVEVLDPKFIAAIRAFVEEGGYAIAERSEADKTPVLYRFSEPTNPAFPFMLEFFSRTPAEFEPGDGQTIIPISTDSDRHSLSAILLDAAYYDLIRTHHLPVDGLNFASVGSLIPLKARAWLDLTARRAAGERIDSRKIDKHSNDVFRLAATLSGTVTPGLPGPILADLEKFLSEFPENSDRWPAILAALKEMGLKLKPAHLISAVRDYFRLPAA